MLIPEHDERESGQQEVYFVHRGAAHVTLDRQLVTAREGAVVSVEPAVTRKFEAGSSPTTLLCIGATPGRPYEIGDWEK